MIQEKAQVVSIEGQYALVQTLRGSVCGKCMAQNGCGTSVLGKILGRRYNHLRVLNECNAKVGDEVVIAIGENGLLKSALMVYMLPLFSALLPMILFQLFFPGKVSEGIIIISAFSGFIAGLVCVRFFSNKIVRDVSYHPVILSVLGDASINKQGMLVP